MLDYTIELLAASGIQEIYVFCQSHAKAIENHLAHSVWQSQPGLKVQTVVAKGCTSMGEALREVYSKVLLLSHLSMNALLMTYG
jgi:translation initiation factor eIF-2B subunit epsilon